MHSARIDLQLYRVFLAFLATTLGFAAYVQIPLAEVQIITFSKSFFVVLLAIVFLHEIVTPSRWLAIIIGFIGVLVIVWPASGSPFNIWHVTTIISAACVAGVMILVRAMSVTDTTLAIIVYQAGGVGILCALPMIYFWQTPTTTEWVLIIGIGLVSAAAQYFNILSIRHAETTVLASLEYTRLLFAALFGLWIFAEWPDMRTWLGAFIIISAAIFVVLRERKSAS